MKQKLTLNSDFNNNFISSHTGYVMTDTIYSPDGNFIWTGSEWIPAPPSGQNVNLQDSVIGGDVVHNTVINNDVDAVTNAVITALERLGMVNKNETTTQLEDTINASIEMEESESKLFTGDRVLVNWKDYGTYFPGKVAAIQDDDTYMIHFDDGDVESNVPLTRIAKQPDSQETQEYVEHISSEEQELIDSFRVFDEHNTGTIHARKLFQILTEMGDPLDIEEVQEMFDEMGISLDSEINYKELAKIMVQPFEAKPQVIMMNASIVDGTLRGFGYGHPKLGDRQIKTSKIRNITYDDRATARVETKNTIYTVGPTGWEIRPEDHPFNKANFAAGQQVKVEWNGDWWDALIREIRGKKYLIHYIGFDSSWDEWVGDSRIKES